MRRYELMLLLRPDLEDDKLQAAVEKVTRAIVNGGGSLSKVSPWGKRRLAYDIGRHREASYFLIHFDIEPAQVREIERGLLISEEILRHLVTVLEDRGPAEEVAPAVAARAAAETASPTSPTDFVNEPSSADPSAEAPSEPMPEAEPEPTPEAEPSPSRSSWPPRPPARLPTRSAPRPDGRRKKEPAMTLNKMMIIGNLGADPELRYTPSGKAVTNLRVAVNDRSKGTDGEWVEETIWIGVEVWEQAGRAPGRAAAEGQQDLRRGPAPRPRVRGARRPEADRAGAALRPRRQPRAAQPRGGLLRG